MKKAAKPIMDRREFIKWSGCVTAAAAAFPMFPGEFVHAQDLGQGAIATGARRTLQSACPYCGVGCGTLISVEGDRIVGMIPDLGGCRREWQTLLRRPPPERHSVVKHLQCIPGNRTVSIANPIGQTVKLCYPWDFRDRLGRTNVPRESGGTAGHALSPSSCGTTW